MHPDNKPTMVFKVEYNNGTTGWLHIPIVIRGHPMHIDQAFAGYIKLRAAKELVSEEDWDELETLFGHTKERALVFEWFEASRRRAIDAARGQTAEVGLYDQLNEWTMSVLTIVWVFRANISRI
ncbi:hypothetical protein BDV18DRAFT_11703 [Aspergillus unguis]